MLHTEDPSTIGKAKYQRVDLDFYPTPEEVTRSIIPFINIPYNELIWEPCVGTFAVSDVLNKFGWNTFVSDIRHYTDAKHLLLDFLNDDPSEDVPQVIVTNPPYEFSREFVQRFLDLPEVTSAFFLLRHEWDAPAKSIPLVTHPSFKCKYVLKRRPRWIEGTTTAPRFPYAWYEWDKTFNGKPTIVYGV